MVCRTGFIGNFLFHTTQRGFSLIWHKQKLNTPLKPRIPAYEQQIEKDFRYRDEMVKSSNLDDPQSLAIGRVLYAAPYELVQEGNSSSTWLSDWAFVQLDPERYELPLEAISNIILQITQCDMDLLHQIPTEARKYPDLESKWYQPLQGFVTEDEQFKAASTITGTERPMLVGKFDNQTQLTYG